MNQQELDERKRIKDYIESILAPNELLPKTWQRIERNTARKNLLRALELPELAQRMIAAGAKLCRFEDRTEWECTVDTNDAEAYERVMAVLKSVNHLVYRE